MHINRIFYFLIFFPTSLFAQDEFPQDYFGNPLTIENVLSGTFAELRSNHFHSGVDIKTQQKVGLKVLTTADGYVSRIKVSHWGYGKAIYITHPNGYTTVYGHLKHFSEKIEAYVKAAQYKKESFEIELFPSQTELIVIKGEQIAASGNTGGSGGPHLHYEIRNTKSEHPINPMLFGMKVKDSRKPTINGVYAYAIGDSSQVNQHNNKVKIKLTKTKKGNYISKTTYASGTIGFGINTVDLQDLAYNKNGVYNIKTYVNGAIHYELDFKEFSFKESRHLNQLIDYSYFKKHKARIQKLFTTINNPLSIIKNVTHNGEILIDEGELINYKIVVTDFNNNSRSITIPIEGKKKTITHYKDIQKTPYFIHAEKGFNFDDLNNSVYIPKNALYKDLYLKYEMNGDTINIGNRNIPLHKNIYLNFNADKFNSKDLKQIFVASLGYNNKRYYVHTYKKDGKIIGRSKNFGKFTLCSDTTPPKIKPINVIKNKWVSKNKTLQVKITDDLTGIKKYRGTINGKWILMEYNAKKNILTYDFKDSVTTTPENNFKLIVIDNVGNSAIFEMTFFRKNKI